MTSMNTSDQNSFRHNQHENSRGMMIRKPMTSYNKHDNTNPFVLNKMSISQMRALHSQALREAEAKQTELRLVLSSRYRELVGSSDEVLMMKDMAAELYSSMEALPDLMRSLMNASEEVVRMPTSSNASSSLRWSMKGDNADSEDVELLTVDKVKYQLSSLPRILHRALDKENPHMASIALVKLFAYMKIRLSSSSNTNKKRDMYPLVDLLGTNYLNMTNGYNNQKQFFSPKMKVEDVDINELLLLDTQIRMVYLHVQTIPLRIIKLAKKVLLRKADSSVDSSRGALSALALLDVKVNSNKKDVEQNKKSDDRQSIIATRLLDTYYDSKAKLLHRLLEDLSQASSIENQQDTFVNRASLVSTIAAKCEKIMSDIVAVIQFDVILHSNDLFCKSSNSVSPPSSLPEFDLHTVKQKCSNFLASHIPVLRSQIRNVLVSSVSVDAGMLGDIRRSLYETTTNPTNISSQVWEEAIDCVIDGRLVSPASYGASSASTTTMSTSSGLTQAQDDLATNNVASQKFSLWSALFSTTFSSLVHDLLSSSFHSVHTSTISTLLQSLSRAPRRIQHSNYHQQETDGYNSSKCLRPRGFSASNLLLRPHEANRNTMLIASQLDRSLQKLSDDAHHLLVHAEEREESERRLRQSLYVQTCEIMGRLLSEIRRMVMKGEQNEDEENNLQEDDENDDATKEMIVGRLCHLLQCKQLAALKILLHPRNAPASTSMSTSSIGSSGILEFNADGSNTSTNRPSTRSGDRARGMITLDELQSAFEIADDDDDGVISFTEAVEAMGGAFSGTPFNGAEMVRSTLLITSASGSSSDARNTASAVDAESRTLQNVTLFELALLSAKGLRHDTEGNGSAMGLIQSCLDSIVQCCFKNWARIVLSPLRLTLEMALNDQWKHGKEVTDGEWLRAHQQENRCNEDGVISASSSISSHVFAYLLSVSCEMNSAICPADSIPSEGSTSIPCLVEIVRKSLLNQSAANFGAVFEKRVVRYDGIDDDETELCFSCSSQVLADVRFIQYLFFSEENLSDDIVNSKEKLDNAETSLISRFDEEQTEKTKSSSNNYSMELSHLFLVNLFGKNHHVFGTDTDSHSYDLTLTSDSSNNSRMLLLNPLESSRRFMLLPIQSEKQINDLELRSTFASKNDEAIAENQAKNNTNAMGTGFGFFSSMLKKK